MAVFENDQIFAEQSDSLGPFALKIDGRANRLPIASHEFAHGRSSANFGQQFILFDAFHLKPLQIALDSYFLRLLFLPLAATLNLLFAGSA